MSSPHSQIPFDLAPRKSPTFESYITSGCNAAVVTHLKNWEQWPSPIMLLIGEQGSGKTHLGTAFASLDEDVVFIDEVDKQDEVELFGQMNRALNGEVKALLLAAQTAPQTWSIQLPDLFSRLSNTAIIELAEPDDALLELIVRDLFSLQGREVSQSVVTYIVARSERTVGALQDLVYKLESRAQTAKADMSRAFVAKHIQLLGAPDDI